MKVLTEYLVVCAHYPKPGHKSHARSKANQQKAKAAVAEHAAHVADLLERGIQTYHRYEEPHRVLTREITPWTELEDEG